MPVKLAFRRKLRENSAFTVVDLVEISGVSLLYLGHSEGTN